MFLLYFMYGVAFTYYGISLNISGFGLNPYLIGFVFASIEMPMKIGVYFFLEKVGRRPGELLTLLLTGLCLFINMFVAKGPYWFLLNVINSFWCIFQSVCQMPRSRSCSSLQLSSILQSCGQSTTDSSLNTVNDILLAADALFKLTPALGLCSQNGVGYTSFLAQLGVSISPLIMLLEDVWHLLPPATYCAVAVGSGLVASLLPETLNTRLPEFMAVR